MFSLGRLTVLPEDDKIMALDMRVLIEFGPPLELLEKICQNRKNLLWYLSDSFFHYKIFIYSS
jgi:hypothetical protein